MIGYQNPVSRIHKHHVGRIRSFVHRRCSRSLTSQAAEKKSGFGDTDEDKHKNGREKGKSRKHNVMINVFDAQPSLLTRRRTSLTRSRRVLSDRVGRYRPDTRVRHEIPTSRTTSRTKGADSCCECFFPVMIMLLSEIVVLVDQWERECVLWRKMLLQRVCYRFKLCGPLVLLEHRIFLVVRMTAWTACVER